ncbi:MAG TPA: sugar isomerase domain-containing protein [Candidatus Aerophobetes bacterium]|uniref:Sugar isomerase domain-containing protein n=1 Tax=Aerophobetes bacterium TaxID=2030807 RepID=A0A7V0MZH3_UNCAE|nr:sugar isomerase domain-containing protein [Candidatus Aerophobetes bacterium]
MWAKEYIEELFELEKKILDSQMGKIVKAGEMIAKSIAKGGVLHVFGTGHSHMFSEELFARAGGLIPVNAILEPSLMFQDGVFKCSFLERIPEYAAVILDRYDVRKGEIMMIFSLSGRNAVPIEMCLEAKNRGLYTIAITSLNHAKASPSRHFSGKYLYEIADLVIDNCSKVGDALLEKKGLPGTGRVGATSTITGSMILQSIVVEAVEKLIQYGKEPPLMVCPNIEGGDEHNRKVFSKYKNRLKHL